jgi:large subunit ribosomal protein L15
MADLHDLSPVPGSTKNRKRVGRGPGSGTGKTAGRGQKGQKARTGHSKNPARFEGGQMPLHRRLPKRGFHNPFRVEYQVVNVGQLGEIEGEVTPESLRGHGLIGSLRRPVKVLGDGELGAALTVRAHAFSATARQKIEAAGGSVHELGEEAKG